MTGELIPVQLVTAAGELFRKASHVVVVTHMSPDGDALGSALAIQHYLEVQGKTVSVFVPNNFPPFFNWMPKADRIIIYAPEDMAHNKVLEEADLVVCTDFNTPKRIGMLGLKIFGLSCPKILIDHHLYPDSFADVTISFPQTPSSSELVYRLVKQLHEPQMPSLCTDFYTCIYTGMMTDTGNFSFNSNYPEMYEIVAELVRAGVDKDAVYDHVFNSHTADRMRLMGYCLYSKMQLFPEEHAALICLTRKDLYRFNFQSGDAEGLVNLPMQIQGICYSCFMREDKVYENERHLANGSNKKVKISMRSKGNRPVNTFCADIFHGGGHKNASGGEFYGSVEDAMALFMQHYKTYCK